MLCLGGLKTPTLPEPQSQVHRRPTKGPWRGRALVLSGVFALGAAAGSSFTSLRSEAAQTSDNTPPAKASPRLAAAVSRADARPNAEAAAPAEVGFSGRTVASAAMAITASIRGNRVYGAGIVIGPRHVLTCLHVVDAMRSIQVSIAERPPEPARLVARDATLDLAVLELEQSQAQYALLASAMALQMGDRVFAMGAPKNMTFSFNSGIVSYVGRRYSELFYLQTDVPTNAGNSGGPVLDERGRVVAVSSFILRDTQGLAFALPIDYAYRRFPEYFAGRFNSRPFAAWLAARDAAPQSEPKMAVRRAAAPSEAEAPTTARQPALD
jgi:S1-C subfamily serine protease